MGGCMYLPAWVGTGRARRREDMSEAVEAERRAQTSAVDASARDGDRAGRRDRCDVRRRENTAIDKNGRDVEQTGGAVRIEGQKVQMMSEVSHH